LFAPVLGAPQNAGKSPSVKVVPFYSTANAKDLQFHGRSRQRWQIVHPISRKFPLGVAAEAQAVAEKGASGKILLVV